MAISISPISICSSCGAFSPLLMFNQFYLMIFRNLYCTHYTLQCAVWICRTVFLRLRLICWSWVSLCWVFSFRFNSFFINFCFLIFYWFWFFFLFLVYTLQSTHTVFFPVHIVCYWSVLFRLLIVLILFDSGIAFSSFGVRCKGEQNQPQQREKLNVYYTIRVYVFGTWMAILWITQYNRKRNNTQIK